MKLIICLDDQNGMLFNRRRQSQDQQLRNRMLQLTAGGRLLMDKYSAGQFESEDQIVVEEEFLETALDSDYCFAERAELVSVIDRVDTLIIYRWNRSYPSDVKVPDRLLERFGNKTSSIDFPGSSHERITEEIYSL